MIHTQTLNVKHALLLKQIGQWMCTRSLAYFIVSLSKFFIIRIELHVLVYTSYSCEDLELKSSVVLINDRRTTNFAIQSRVFIYGVYNGNILQSIITLILYQTMFLYNKSVKFLTVARFKFDYLGLRWSAGHSPCSGLRKRRSGTILLLAYAHIFPYVHVYTCVPKISGQNWNYNEIY